MAKEQALGPYRKTGFLSTIVYEDQMWASQVASARDTSSPGQASPEMGEMAEGGGSKLARSLLPPAVASNVGCLERGEPLRLPPPSSAGVPASTTPAAASGMGGVGAGEEEEGDSRREAAGAWRRPTATAI